MHVIAPHEARSGLASPPARVASACPQTGLRPEIQALRAVAVALVVAWHLWPADVPGGFVGVDVFFVISGFLITTLLVRERDRTGRVSLRGFWARRARRILPAALTVIAACAGATALLVPVTEWSHFFGDFRASTLYVQNWHLSARAVDYFAASDGPSPVQHFWSLAVEEQFYLVWPLVLVAALRVSRRWALPATLGTIAAASLAYGIARTASHPADAYFATTTRGWELAAGALLALVPAAARPRPVLAAVGLGGILVAALAYDDSTPFPGVAGALPVLAAVAVIRGGDALRALRAAPLQRVGDISYAVYLWHWPLIVLAPYALGHALHTPDRLAIIMLTLLLAALSKVLLEDPIRRTRRFTFVAAAAATAAVLGLTLAGTGHVQAQIRADARATAQTLEHKPKCFGAAARDPRRTCVNPKLSREVVPTPVQAPKMDNSPCEVVEKRGRVRACAFGAAPARGVRTVALIGDSHASHWRSAVDVVVKAERWRGLSVTHTSCPYSAATAVIPQPARGQCLEWKRDVRAWLARHPEIDTVFFGQHSGGTVIAPPGRGQWAAQVDGYKNAWRALPRTIRHVLVFRDTPKMRSATMGCVQRAMDGRRDAGPACAQPRATALGRDPAAVAAAHAGRAGVATIDLTRLLCDARRCFPVIGGALVYKDIHHLTSVFAATLGPFVQRRVEAVLSR
jgi:peptidoglycan/LPS O-acetylase OafA/YrhL